MSSNNSRVERERKVWQTGGRWREQRHGGEREAAESDKRREATGRRGGGEPWGIPADRDRRLQLNKNRGERATKGSIVSDMKALFPIAHTHTHIHTSTLNM